MGHKVNPRVLRLGFIRNWSSCWFSSKNALGEFIEEDVRIRRYIKTSYHSGTIAEIIIARLSPTSTRISIRTSRPGVVIGRRGQDIERVREEIASFTSKEVFIDVEEIENPSMEAVLIAENIAFQLEKRVSHRRAMKRSIQMALLGGVQGIKVRCSGRLTGAEIARSEVYKVGKIPLSTFNSDIDYGFSVARTRYGTIGVKVWIYKGKGKKGGYIQSKQEAA